MFSIRIHAVSTRNSQPHFNSLELCKVEHTEREREKKIIIVTRKIGSGNGRSYGKLINGIDVRCELMVIAELEYIKPAALFPYFRHLFLSLSRFCRAIIWRN